MYILLLLLLLYMNFIGGSDGKKSACNAGDLDLIPRSGRSPGEGNSYPLQYSCLENPIDRGAWWTLVHRISKLDMTERLTHTHTYMFSILIINNQELGI